METVLRVADAVREHGAWTVRHRVDRGWWQRPCRGVVVTHNGPLSPTELDLVALASGPRRTALAGPTALRFDGFDARDRRHVVVLPSGARPPSSATATAHWSTMLDDRDVHPCAPRAARRRHARSSTPPPGTPRSGTRGGSSSRRCKPASWTSAACAKP